MAVVDSIVENSGMMRHTLGIFTVSVLFAAMNTLPSTAADPEQGAKIVIKENGRLHTQTVETYYAEGQLPLIDVLISDPQFGAAATMPVYDGKGPPFVDDEAEAYKNLRAQMQSIQKSIVDDADKFVRYTVGLISSYYRQNLMRDKLAALQTRPEDYIRNLASRATPSSDIALALSQLLAEASIASRIVMILPSENLAGVKGHRAIEYWSTAQSKSIYADGTDNFVAIDRAGKGASIFEIFDNPMLLTSVKSSPGGKAFTENSIVSALIPIQSYGNTIEVFWSPRPGATALAAGHPSTQ